MSARKENRSSYNRKIRSFTEESFQVEHNQDEILSKVNKKKNESPKIEFRKVLKPRTKHSRVGDIDQMSNTSQLSSRSTKYFDRTFTQNAIKFKAQNDNGKQSPNFDSNNGQKSLQRQAQQNLLRQFTEQIKNQNQNWSQKNYQSNRISQKEIKKNETNLKRSLQIDSQIKSSLQKRNRLNSSRCFNKDSILEKPQKMKDNEENLEEKQRQKNKSTLLRPKSSAFNFIPIDKIKNKQQNTSQLSSYNKQKLQKSYQIRKKSQKTTNLQMLIKIFLQFESNITELIAEKWKLIEQKISHQKSLSKLNNKKSHLSTNQYHSLQFQEIDSNNYQQPNSKFSFSKAINQKNIDNQIMNQIKLLRNLNFHSYQKNYSADDKKLIEEIQKRKAEIIEKALAQSMVESQLLKKYYSKQNAKTLSTSNHKVGQMNMKNKVIQENIRKIQVQERNPYQQKKSQARKSISKQTQSNSNFMPPNQQDYQKFRYQHPEFKPNLQPLPRSSYNLQFFKYNNLQIFHPKFKQESNIVFPNSLCSKSSSYRKQYRQFSPQRVNYKQLDAYKDKFKRIDFNYIPKKRSQSEAQTTRKDSKNNKYVNQLDFVKRLKTQSILQNSINEQLTKRLVSKYFHTETKKEYQNPERLSQKFDRSEIKHKKLNMLKYQMKRKFHV